MTWFYNEVGIDMCLVFWDQISGANVQVYDPCAGKSGGRVVISGTPDQTFAAQSLLQAFIQTGQTAPE